VICSSCGAANPAGMQFCGMCGAKMVQQRASRERRRVSMLFVDLAGFSTLTRDLDPEEMRDLADEVLTVVTGVVESYDGYVDSLRGDGLIALFGAPHSHPDDAQRAVLAAAAGLNAIVGVGRARGLPLTGRAGVNTGVVIAGAVGSGRVRSYTVMGSAVNLASRLEQAAEPGEVWVGPETYQSTRHRLLYENTGPITLRGFPNVTNAHRLLTSPVRRRLDPYAHLPFVGRQAELARLRQELDDVVVRRAQLELWLHGEAGHGKTRLLQEFSRNNGRQALTLWFRARPNEEFSWEPLGRQVFGLKISEDAASAHLRVQRVLDSLLPGQKRWHELLLTSLELATTKSWTRLERRSIDRTAVAWRDLLAAMPSSPGGPQALLLLVDNEPRDPVLTEFLTLLLESTAPVMIVRTTRSRRESGSPPGLELPPLTHEQSVQLLSQLTPPTNLSAATALLDQVGGVPAHVLELGRSLSITPSDILPASLESLLQARIDLLEPSPRHLLTHAALVGEVTWDGMLRELGGAHATEDIKTLQHGNLLLPQASSAIPGEVEYRFQSELVREAAVRMVPYADRPLLHLRIATWLEQHAPLAFSELTAAQFELGGSPDAAYAHYLAAAELAASRGERQTTVRLYHALLDLELPAEMLAEGALAYAQAATSLGLLEPAQGALKRAKQLLAEAPSERRAPLLAVLERLQGDMAAPA
jgi:class 3 adenylate cyclase